MIIDSQRASPSRPLAVSVGRAAVLVLSVSPLRALDIFAGDGLGASDPWRHVAWAHLLRSSPVGGLREWPVFTVLHRYDVDLWWLFHRLLVPFTFGDLESGARAAALFYGSLGLVAIAFVFHRVAPARAGWAFFALLAFSQSAYYRWLTARPSVLTVALLVIAAWGYFERRPGVVLAASFLHGWLHVSVPLQVVLAVCAVAAARIAGNAPSWKLVLAAGIGSVAGVLARPHPLSYLAVAWVQGTLPFRSTARLTGLGTEIYPAPAWMLFWTAPCLVVMLATLMGTVSRLRQRKVSQEELFLAGAAVAFLVLAFGSRRFLELQGPFALLYAAHSLDLSGWPLLRTRLARVGAGVLIALGLAANAADGILSMSYPYPSARLKAAADAVVAHVPPGRIVFHDNWQSYAKLFFHDPTHRYILGCDPTFMLSEDSRRFWLWYHLGHQGLRCEAPSEDSGACPSTAPGADELDAALAEYGASAVVLSDGEERPGLARALDRFPDRFPRVYQGTGVDEGVSVYLVARALGGQ